MSSFSEKAQREFLQEVEWSTLRVRIVVPIHAFSLIYLLSRFLRAKDLAVSLQFNTTCVLEAAALLARATRDARVESISTVSDLVDAIEAALKTSVLRGTQPLMRWFCVHLARISLAQIRVPKYRYVPPLHAIIREPPPALPSALPTRVTSGVPAPLPYTPSSTSPTDYSAVPYRYDAENRTRSYARNPTPASALEAVDALEPPAKRRRYDAVSPNSASAKPSHKASPPPGIDLSDAGDPYLRPVGEPVHIFETSMASHLKTELFTITRSQLRAPSRLVLRLFKVTTNSDLARGRVTRAAVLEWPPETQLSLNRTRVPVPSKASGIIDVTTYCTPGLNQLDLILKELKAVYVGVLQEMHATSADALLTALPRLNSDWTLALVRTSFKGGDAEELVEVARQVSLIDAVGRTRFTHPVRALSCTHVQVFDARVWLLVNEKTRQWKCPLCARPIRWEDVRRDAYFDDILARVPASVTEVTLREDGSWSVPDIVRGAPDTSNSELVVLLDSDDERDDAPAPPAASLPLSPPRGQPALPAVIDLTDSPLHSLSAVEKSNKEEEKEELKASTVDAHTRAKDLPASPEQAPGAALAVLPQLLPKPLASTLSSPLPILPEPSDAHAPLFPALDHVETTDQSRIAQASLSVAADAAQMETTFHVTFNGLSEIAASSPLPAASPTRSPVISHRSSRSERHASRGRSRSASRSPSRSRHKHRRHLSRDRTLSQSRNRRHERVRETPREREWDHDLPSQRYRYGANSDHDYNRDRYDYYDDYHHRDAHRYTDNTERGYDVYSDSHYEERDSVRRARDSSRYDSQRSSHSYKHRRHY